MIHLAQLPPVNWGLTVTVLLGLIGVLALYVLIINAVIATRKAFGRTPPMHEQIVKLRDEFVSELARHEAELSAWQTKHEAEDEREVTRLEGKIDNVDRDVRQLRQEINTNGEVRKNYMLGEINRHYERLDAKIAEVSEQQTAHLIAALKGKND